MEEVLHDMPQDHIAGQTAPEVSVAGVQQVAHIVATVEENAELLLKLEETQTKLAEMEAKLAQLSVSASAAQPNGSRTTLPAGMRTMLEKQGASSGDLEVSRMEAGSLDSALSSLSIEQRFAIKAELFRGGFLG